MVSSKAIFSAIGGGALASATIGYAFTYALVVSPLETDLEEARNEATALRAAFEETSTELSALKTAFAEESAKLEAFEASNDIAALYVRAYELGVEAQRVCSSRTGNQSPSYRVGELTQAMVEYFGGYFQRDNIPVSDMIVLLEELEENDVQLIVNSSIGPKVSAQFFRDEKILVIGSFLAIGAADFSAFIGILRGENFAPEEDVVAMMNRTPVTYASGTYILRGNRGEVELFNEGDHTVPVKMLERPCL